jgi:hypothetical protein
MTHSEKITPVAAALSAVSTLACCLPSGIAMAAGAAGIGVVMELLRPWLIGFSIARLEVGFVQLNCSNRQPAPQPCGQRSLPCIGNYHGGCARFSADEGRVVRLGSIAALR